MSVDNVIEVFYHLNKC